MSLKQTGKKLGIEDLHAMSRKYKATHDKKHLIPLRKHHDRSPWVTQSHLIQDGFVWAAETPSPSLHAGSAEYASTKIDSGAIIAERFKKFKKKNLYKNVSLDGDVDFKFPSIFYCN